MRPHDPDAGCAPAGLAVVPRNGSVRLLELPEVDSEERGGGSAAAPPHSPRLRPPPRRNRARVGLNMAEAMQGLAAQARKGVVLRARHKGRSSAVRWRTREGRVAERLVCC
jgi:hypothetical protein